MTDADSKPDREHHPFDMAEWLASVRGETVVLVPPKGFPNLPALYFLPKWSRTHREFYCSDCDRMRFPVFEEHGCARKHCPVCGNVPGALELGTDGTFREVRPNVVDADSEGVR